MNFKYKPGRRYLGETILHFAASLGKRKFVDELIGEVESDIDLFERFLFDVDVEGMFH